MNKFYQKFLVFVLCLGLVLPSGLFASSNENYNTTPQFKSNSLIKAKVVNFGPLPQIAVVESKLAINSVCAPTPTPQNSLLGGDMDLNLNQPANCFKIVENQILSSQIINIAASTEVWPKVIVLGTGNFFLKPLFAANLPKLPEATEIFVVLALLGTVFTTKKSVQYDLAQRPENFVFKPGIVELQILRC